MDLVVGRVSRAHGIRGELLVDVHTDEPRARFAVGAQLVVQHRSGTRSTSTVTAARPHGERLLLTIDHLADRTAAEAYRGALLLIDSADLDDPADPDEFHDHQLVGLRAELDDGTVAGVVTDVVHGPAGELLVLDRDGREVLVPFVRAIVPTVDVAGGRVVLTPPDGLLDELPAGDSDGSGDSGS